MQSVSSRIWTHVTVSISYDDNYYTTGTYVIIYGGRVTVIVAGNGQGDVSLNPV